MPPAHWVHVLSDIDAEARTGTCASCGPVTVKNKGPQGWRCNEAEKASKRAWTASNSAAVIATRRRFRLKNYGLTEEAFLALFASQGGVCAICKTPPEDDPWEMSVDHDHACCDVPAGKIPRSCGTCIRGLTCNTCNFGLGNFRDSPELLEAAAAYLRASRA